MGKTLVMEIFKIKGRISKSRKLKKFSKAEAYNVGKRGEMVLILVERVTFINEKKRAGLSLLRAENFWKHLM